MFGLLFLAVLCPVVGNLAGAAALGLESESEPNQPVPHARRSKVGSGDQNQTVFHGKKVQMLHARRQPPNSAQGCTLVCGGVADIVILADMSGSVGVDGRAATQSFLRALIDHMQLSRHGGQLVSIISFAEHAQLHTHLTDDAAAIDAAISALQLDDFGANLAPALVTAKAALRYGSRSHAASNVLVIVDGMLVSQNAAEQKAADVGGYAKLVGLLVGSDSLTAEYTLSWLDKGRVGGPAEGRLLWMPDWDVLGEIGVEDTLPMICPNILTAVAVQEVQPPITPIFLGPTSGAP